MSKSENAQFRCYERVTAEILGRWSVTDLIEQTEADLIAADKSSYKPKFPVEAIDQGELGLIRWWRVVAGENKFYEVRRFRNFVWCSCEQFFDTKRMCTHAVVTCGVYCVECHEMPATKGKLCSNCDSIPEQVLAAR